MAESLIDFPGAAHLWMQQQHLQDEQRRETMYEQNSLRQAQQQTIRNQRMEEAQQQENDTRRASNLLTFSKDPAVRANPATLDPILGETWRLIGPKNVTPDVLMQGLAKGRDDVAQALTGLASGNQEQALQGFTKIAITSGPEVADQLAKAAGDTSKLAETIRNVGIIQKYEGERVEKLNKNVAMIAAGADPMATAVGSMSHLLEGTDNPAYLTIAKAVAKTPSNSGYSDVSAAADYAKAHPELKSGGQFTDDLYTKDAVAKADAKAQEMNVMAGEARRSLALHLQNQPLPPNTTEHDLRARIEVGDTLMKAYGSMAAFAENPYDLATLKEAKKAQAEIVAKSKELNALKPVVSQEKFNIYQEARDPTKSPAFAKKAVDDATAEAQARFAALPSASQHSQGAAIIARAVKRDMNVMVPVEDILKGKEKPGAEGSLTADQSANLVIKTLVQAAGDAGAADVIDPVTGAVDFGRLIHKSARDQQAFIDSIRTKAKLKEFSWIKDSLEIVARDATEKMTQTAASKREMLDAKSQLPSVDSKEIQDAVATGKPFVYEKGGHKFKLEGKGKSQQWVVVE